MLPPDPDLPPPHVYATRGSPAAALRRRSQANGDVITPPGRTWTLWSRIYVGTPTELTLSQLVALLEEKLGVEVSMLSKGSTTLYSSLAPPSQQKSWMGMSVRQTVAAATGKPDASGGAALYLQASCYDEESEEDVEMPMIAYRVAS